MIFLNKITKLSLPHGVLLRSVFENYYVLRIILLKMCTQDSKSYPLRLPDVSGFDTRRNDIVYNKPLNNSHESRIVVYFPGDVQDYLENMKTHRDNKHYKQWSLENTATTLQKHFPQSHILVIKPSRMDYKTFSCFQNFVKSSQLGVPDHTSNYNSLRHLDSLIKNVSVRLLALEESNGTSDSNSSNRLNLPSLNLEIIGFSKGCVVLNQFLHEFHNFATVDRNEEILSIIRKIKDMYWLDGGHSGGKNTWVNDKEVLKTLCTLGINIHVHVSPYQINDDRRPWIKKEEKAFTDFLQKHGCNIHREVHFEAIPPSISTHFQVINAFKK